MKSGKWILAHFSPTGGTKKIADAISAALEIPSEDIDLCLELSPRTLGEGDMLIALLPVYCGRVPAAALQKLSSIKAAGNKAAAVVVYGNREYDDALVELYDSLEDNGFQVIAAAAFIAEHSVIRTVAKDRPDAADIGKAAAFAKALEEKAASENCAPLFIPGNRPYIEMKNLTVHPSADDKCSKCGVCVKGCPVGAISTEAPDKSIHGICINCMRCVDICPCSARSMPEAYLAGSAKMLSEKAAGYKEPVFFI